jgi:hypothetical protein
MILNFIIKKYYRIYINQFIFTNPLSFKNKLELYFVIFIFRNKIMNNFYRFYFIYNSILKLFIFT